MVRCILKIKKRKERKENKERKKKEGMTVRKQEDEVVEIMKGRKQ